MMCSSSIRFKRVFLLKKHVPASLNISSQLFMTLDSNHTMAYRPVAKQWICKQLPLLGNTRNLHARNNRRTVFSKWHALRPLLWNGAVNTPLQHQRDCVFCVVRAVKKRVCNKVATWVETYLAQPYAAQQVVAQTDWSCMDPFSCKSEDVKRRFFVWYL
jgi:hypothetical protein